MKDFSLDKDGKFVKSNFGFTVTPTTIDYVIQKIRIRLQTFLGEWYLDTTLGLPYFQIQEKNPNIKLIEAAMKEKIMGVEGVESILSFKLVYDNSKRTLKPSFTVSTTSGETGGVA